MTKCKKCFSLSEELVSTISRISSKTAIPESVVVEKYLDKCVSKEIEMTAAERYNFQRKFIVDSLDSVLRLFGIMEHSGGIQDKFRCALYTAQGNLRGKNREYRNGIIETSLFEILEDIRTWDNGIWKDLTTHMSYFGKIRSRYFYLYPKSPKKSITPLFEEDTITNNNTSIDSIIERKRLRERKNSVTESEQDNSVTESKEPDHLFSEDKESFNPT